MQQLMAVWQALDNRRRMIVGGATILMFAAVLALSNVVSQPSLLLLYANLEGAQSGEVISALEQRAVPYEVRGDAIYVDSTRRDELRMTLAAEGLPTIGGAGYELLDQLSGFGTTSQMFDAAYWRAKEGELARTIVANPMIRSARVHIANPVDQPFRKDLHPTASVMVSTAAGGLSASHAKALKFLVASAVSGMAPEDVSVIDTNGGLVSSGEDETGAATSRDRAADLKRNVERLLEARVGYGNAVVEVSLQAETEREAITQRTIDPSARVAISTDTEERSTSSNDTKPGAVTVASNLPSGAAAAGGTSQSQNSETRERTNFDVSETTREVVRAPGAIKRLTVAVLVDGIEATDAAGTTSWTPRTDEELSALRELVASAVGFDEARGDVITIRSMAFEPVAELGTSATGGMFSGRVDVMQLAQVAVLALVALVLGLFVMRPILTRPMPQVAGLPAPEGMPQGPALTGEIADDGPASDPAMTVVSDFDMGDLQMPMAMGSGFGEDELSDDPVARLKRLIESRQTETVEILRSWMEDEKERS